MSDQGTVAVTADGKAYWWGLRPWPMREWRAVSMRAAHRAAPLNGAYREFADAVTRGQPKGGAGGGGKGGGKGGGGARGRGGGGGGGKGRGGGGGGESGPVAAAVTSLEDLMLVFETGAGHPHNTDYNLTRWS